jgi:MarR family transcriptional regulator for hemolysin
VERKTRPAPDQPPDQPLPANTPPWLVPPPVAATDPAAFTQFLFVRRLLQISRHWRNQLSTNLREMPDIRSGWRTLFWLSLAGRTATQRELAQRVGVDESTLARALDKLEQQGFVKRAVDPDDRRAKRITLTAAATPVLDRIGEVAIQVRVEILRDIDPAELALCLKVLDQISDAFDRLEAAEPRSL